QELNYLNYEIIDGIAVVRFDCPDSKVNSLNEGLMQDAFQIFNDLQRGSIPAQGIVLISAKTDCFVAGADIKMLERCKSAAEVEGLARKGQEFFNQIENSPIPIVAAIQGSCLGGGLELALASHYRIAVNDKKTQLALPEVMLGLLPGGGGTQRLPRMINVPDALQMMLMGKNIRPDKAKRMGLVDLVVDPLGPGVEPPEIRTLAYLEEVAISIAKKLASKELKIERKRPLQEKLLREALKIQYIRDKVLGKARAEVNKFAKGLYPAPLKIIECVDAALSKPFDDGLRFEAQAFGELSQTTHSKALIGLFHGQTLCKKNRYGSPKKPVETAAVLGAGLMGAGIAQVTVQNGVRTILKDTAQAGLLRGQQQITTAMAKDLKRKKIDLLTHDRINNNLIATLDYDQFKSADLVIEAVFEDIKVKHKVLQEIESVTRDDCIFASNTSAIPIGDIAQVSKRPENVIGMHYFSPVDKMQLLEIITTDKTSKETAAAAVDLGLRQKKVVIVVKDCPGFYTVRCLAPVMSEIMLLLQEGMSPKEMDEMSTKFGFPVGSATLTDEVGIDVGQHVAQFLSEKYPARMVGGDPRLLQEMVSKGFLGRKSGKGFYIYDNKKKSKSRELNPEAMEILKKYHVAPKMKCTEEDYQMRLAFRFINEAILCLQDGILDNPLEGDIGAVFGLGFPPFMGGPFRFTDQYGAQKVVDVGKRFSEIYGSQFLPCQLLLDVAKNGTKFHKSAA
ncbi:3-hydroxyacyl-CoA dehydrogenase-like protein 3, partial [Sarcoptes scabiei]